ncbi:MAG: trimeric autotransporter adhesin, partial [Actinomycetota bacterium]|nr:trimeric autotransporter adhesin [Actinomycetota bacterium]
MPPDTVIMSPLARTHRAGWGWLLLATVARAYLAFLGSLAACALLPMLCGLSGAVVQSGSMEPHISAGDVVLSQTSGAGSALPMGRVITFRAPTGSATNGFVLHRLVASNKNGTLVTKGDANASPDSTPLDRRNIKSQARLLIPWMGLPAFWVTSGLFLPLGIWLLLTVVALCIALTEATGQFSSLLTRVQIGSGPAAVALVAIVTAGALAAAPLGQAAAAFSATTSTQGDTWGTTGPAVSLAFTTEPSDSTGGIAFDTQPVVEVLDAHGDIVDVSSARVTLSVTTPAGATLTCMASTTPAVAGEATFAGCGIDKAGIYRLTASSGTLTSDVTGSFVITTGPATKLAFTTSPSFSNVGVAFFTQPVVAIEDTGGNTLTSNTAPVALTLTTAAGAALTCTANTESAVAGKAAFRGCKIDKAGTYTLTAASAGLLSAVSASFAIVIGSTTKLAFTTNPSGATGGTSFGTQPVVAVQDAVGNTVAASSASVTMVITNPAGAVLTCAANPKNAVAGVVTFGGCKIDKAGTYTLTAASAGLTNAVSASLTITAGTATKL